MSGHLQHKVYSLEDIKSMVEYIKGGGFRSNLPDTFPDNSDDLDHWMNMDRLFMALWCSLSAKPDTERKRNVREKTEPRPMVTLGCIK